MTAHTNFQKGQRVLVVLKDGTQFEDHYEEARSKFIVLRERGKLRRKNIRAVVIPK